MLLIDATGYGDNNRFQQINEGVEMLLQGLDNTCHQSSSRRVE
jgi:hypothetical protein